jgi:hypothetical protein
LTIAVAYVGAEGIVLGADSTSSVPCESGFHFFDFNQKLFEIGEGSTTGMLTWGLGALGSVSYRTLIAQLADDLAAAPPSSVQNIAERWVDAFWGPYQGFELTQRLQQLAAMSVYDPNVMSAQPGSRTKEEQDEFDSLRNGLVVGFCVAGYVMPDRTPQAAYMVFDPLASKPPATLMGSGSRWWGIPNMISRLLNGADENLRVAILSSGKWVGSPQDLNDILFQQALSHAALPMRDAVDFVYSCIHATIKAMKFSSLPQLCGGPIEVAVITTDRKFRWVKHKPWDAAITDGAL